jgi:uncharacterized protein YuzE
MAGMKLWYDREGDLLEVVFEDAPATLEEISEDVFERRAADGRVIGFAVMNFSKHHLDELSLPFEVKVLPAA